MGDEMPTVSVMKNSNVQFLDDGTSELKKRDLVNELLHSGPTYLKSRSIAMVNAARNKHQKIPYVEIGKALRYTAVGLTDEQLGKLFLKQ